MFFRSISAAISMVMVMATAVAAAPLHDAAQEGDVAKIRKLLADGVKVDQRDPMFGSALNVAAAAGHADAVEVLLQAGAKVDRAAGMLGRPCS